MISYNMALRQSIVQYSAVQHSIVQYSTVRYGTGPYSTVQYSTVQHSQHSTAQHSTALYCTARRSTVHHSTAQYSTAQCRAAQCSALQYSIAPSLNRPCWGHYFPGSVSARYHAGTTVDAQLFGHTFCIGQHQSAKHSPFISFGNATHAVYFGSATSYRIQYEMSRCKCA